MHEPELAEQFEAHRARLRAGAYRMLGSSSESEDAVQEAWLRLRRSDPGVIENLAGWLTTVVSHVCLDMLRARARRRESPLSRPGLDERQSTDIRHDPESEAESAELVGLALLVVLDRLAPAERVALVLHDVLSVPFADIAEVVGRSSAATRQLASRARRRVHGASPRPDPDRARRWEVADAFLAGTREGHLDALLAVLDPDAVCGADRRALPANVPAELRGARPVAEGTLV